MSNSSEARERQVARPTQRQTDSHRLLPCLTLARFSSDCGGVVNCLVNAAWSKGLGCVINSQGIMQSPVVRAEANIPADQVIQTCVAMGWPDDTFPANAVVSERKKVEECAHFIGFEEDEAPRASL